MTQELKACVYCGGAAYGDGEIKYSSFDGRWADGTRIKTAYQVNCIACGTNNRGLIGFQTKQEAHDHWNTRPREDALEAEVEALRRANDLLTWLDIHGELELSWGCIDDLPEIAWRVHSSRGGINDREWRLIATGDTPAEALASARAALGETQ